MRSQILALALIEAMIFFAAPYLAAVARFSTGIAGAEQDIGVLWPRGLLFACASACRASAASKRRDGQRSGVHDRPAALLQPRAQVVPHVGLVLDAAGDAVGAQLGEPHEELQPDEAAVFRALARQARQIVVVADSSKGGSVSPAVVCQPKQIDLLITDNGISEEATAAFSAAGCRAIAASP